LPIHQAPGFELSLANLQSYRSGLQSGYSTTDSRVFLISTTPLNLHRRFLTRGFLQTAVSNAPRTPPEIYLPLHMGASDTALAFLDSFLIADYYIH
jgi:hypothetical protein